MVMVDGEDKSSLVLGIDTCGPAGGVALGRLSGENLEVQGQAKLEGRTYSARLVAVVGELLAEHGAKLRDVGTIVVVNGPGSFTGVRVGLSAVKGFAMAAGMPVVAVSRLAVLAGKARVEAAALDAHRSEIFLRVGERELLAGAEELAEMIGPKRVAVCDEAATKLLRTAWTDTELLEQAAPTAVDALRLAAAQVLARNFVDVALLDGNYLRRSDAEIHFDKAETPVG